MKTRRVILSAISGALLAALALLLGGCLQQTTPSPIACIEVDPTIGYAPLAVTFNASCSFVSAGAEDVYHFRWEFDDGTDDGTGLRRTTTHTFTESGTYTIYVLMINSAHEWVDSASRVITVLPAD